MLKPTNDAAAELSTLMVLSPLVIASRMTEFWMTAASPTAQSKREASRMVSEKVLAAGESLAAVHVTLTRLAVETVAAAATGTLRQTHNDADQIWAAALRPYSARVCANRTRLTR